jgi:hypothetical protein
MVVYPWRGRSIFCRSFKRKQQRDRWPYLDTNSDNCLPSVQASPPLATQNYRIAAGGDLVDSVAPPREHRKLALPQPEGGMNNASVLQPLTLTAGAVFVNEIFLDEMRGRLCYHFFFFVFFTAHFTSEQM